MSTDVFISYARTVSSSAAQALASRIGPRAFLDISQIDDGSEFPEILFDALLDASIVVIFASAAYSERRFCRLECQLALAGGNDKASHIVLALDSGCDVLLDSLPAAVACRTWPASDEIARLESLVKSLLGSSLPRIRQRLPKDEARRLLRIFLDSSKLPVPQSLSGIPCSLPKSAAGFSLGDRFVGRTEDLRTIHRVLSGHTAGGAPIIARLTAGGGFGKTRLAACR